MTARKLLDGNLIPGELTSNGTFDGDFDWAKQTSRWGISAGVASVTDVAEISTLTQVLYGIDPTKTYTVSVEMTAVASGTCSVHLGDYDVGDLTTVTTLTDTAVTGFTGTTLTLTAAASDTFSIDNVTVYETADGAPTGPNLASAFTVRHPGAGIFGQNLSTDIALQIKCGDEWAPATAAGTAIILASTTDSPLSIPVKGEYRLVASALVSNERVYFDQ